MPDQKDTVLGKLAVERGYVTQEQLDEALANQSKMRDEMGIDQPIAQILVGKGWLTGDQLKELTRAAAHETGAVRIVGGYEVVARLGHGGMGAVYKARKLDTGQFVALKVLPPSLATESLVARFKREAEITRRLTSDNIVGCVEFGFDEKRKCQFCALEFIEGEDLRLRIKKTGRLPEKEAIGIARGVAKALQHAFLNGLVHRDVKPANIMVMPEGNAKLLDLGLARPTDRKDVRLTQSGAFVGSAYYASPEQASGRDDIDIRADVYSLGATLYHMVTGRPPFDGESMMTVLQKQIGDTVAWPADVEADVSEGMSWVIAKMMAKDPDERYETPGDVVADLDLLAEGAEPAAAGRPPRKSTVAHPRQRRAARSRSPRRAAGAARESTRRPRAAPEEERSKMPYALVGGMLAGLAALGVIWAVGRPKRKFDEPSPPAPPAAAVPQSRPEPRAKAVERVVPPEPEKEPSPEEVAPAPPPMVETPAQEPEPPEPVIPEVAVPGPTPVTMPVAAGAARGLLGTYFTGTELRQRVLERIDPQVVFDWGKQSPAPGLPDDEFSVRWEGFIVPPATGDHELSLRSDDGARLWVGGQQLLDRWGGQILSFTSPPIHLEAGRPCEVRLEYMEHRVHAKVSLLWRGPGMAEAVPIPPDCLRPPAGHGGPAVAAATADTLGHGLVGHWKFDESEGRTACDSSGNGNDSKVYGHARWVDGRIGRALSLDGVDDHTTVSHDLALEPQNITVSTWFQARTLPKGRDWLVGKNVHELTDAHYGLAVHDEKVGATRYRVVAHMNVRGTTHEASSSAGSIAIGRWHHAAMTYDGVALTLYLDGAPVGRMVVNLPRTAGRGILSIGMRPDGESWSRFNGLIDDVRIHKRALLAEEVKALFESRSGPVPPTEPEEPKRPAWLLVGLDPLLMKGDHAGAQAWLAKAAGDDKYAEATDEIAAAFRVAASSEARHKAAVAGAGARVGKETQLAGRTGRPRKGEVKAVTEKGIDLVTKYIIAAGGKRHEKEKHVTVRWEELAPDQVDELAHEGGWKPAASDAAIARAYMALGRKDRDAAQKALGAAGDHPLAEGVRRRISILRLGVADAAAKEAWEALRKESERKLTSARAEKLLAKIKAFEQAHGGTRFFAEHADEIRRLAAAVETRTAEGRIRIGLIHYWPFEDVEFTAKGGKAKDVTGGDLDFRIKSDKRDEQLVPELDVVDGVQGKALQQNGVLRDGFTETSRLQQSPALAKLNNMEQLTLCLWARPGRLFEGKRRAGIIGRSLHADRCFGIYLEQMRPISYLGNFSESSNLVHGKTTLQVGTWYHLALVFDGNAPAAQRHKLYVNGAIEATGRYENTTTPHGSISLSLAYVHGRGNFMGAVDEVRIYNRPLSPVELRAVMALAGKAAATTAPSAPAAEPGAKSVAAAETGIAPAGKEPEARADEATPDAKLEASLREFDARLEARDFDGARRAIPAGARDATAEAAQRLAGSFAAWRDAARKGAGALKGSEAEIESRRGKVSGTVLEVDDSGITLVFQIKEGRRVLGESKTSVAWRDLTLRQEQKLAASGGWKLGGADGAVFDAVVALWRKDANAAEKALARAPGHPLAAHYRARVAVQRFGEAEAAALRAWKRAEKLFAAKDMKGAREAYKAFEREHGKTRTAAKQAAALRERREAIDRVIIPREIKVDLGGGVSMEFVLVPAGEFRMGEEGVAEPVHKVKITKPFYLGKYEVTQAQYERVMGVNPSEFKGAGFPVENVSWADTQKFVAKANALLTQSDGPRYTFRPPTEAEWEYACRAGTRTEYNTGQGEAALEKAGWYSRNSGGRTNPVGKKAPNALGLHDMHGNVSEIVQDRAGRYSADPAVDPRGPTEGWNRVHRGGSWKTEAGSCRSASRANDNPGHRRTDHGFRCVVEAAGQAVTTPATIHWLMADNMDIYQNGEPLRTYTPSFRTRRDEARRKSAFSADIILRPGDVFTVGGRRGGSYGGTVVVVDKQDKLVWCSNVRDWRVYEPADPERWYLPDVAMRSRQSPVRVARSFGYQAQMRRDHYDIPQPIWGDESQRFVYMVGVYGRAGAGRKPQR